MKGAVLAAARRRLLLAPAVALLLLAGGALLPATAPAVIANPDPSLISVWQPCERDTGVTVIVDFQALGNHDVQVRCAPGEPASGVYALTEAGFAVAGTLQWGTSFICRIDGLPTPAEEGCEYTPGQGHYWAYYHARPGGQWEYSGKGASAYVPEIGTVEGWGFAQHQVPGGPDIRIPAQDGRGATLELPPTSSSSAIQLRLGQEWLVRKLLAAVPAAAGGSSDSIGQIVTYAAALTRSGYPLGGPRFQAARELLAAPATAAYTGFEGKTAAPRPERLGPYAIALAALEGGEPTLSDGTKLRRWLTEDIEPGTGKVLEGRDAGGGVEALEDGPKGAAVLEALARTGALPARATALIEMIERTQRPDGSFVGTAQNRAMERNLTAMLGLRAARDAGGGSSGLDESIAKLSGWVLDLQEPDGSISPAGAPDPVFVLTTPAASILALGGASDAAVEAARWSSRYQVTADLAGGGPNSTTGGPGAGEVGGFARDLPTLREVITSGVGPLAKLGETTPMAVEALALAPWLDPEPARASASYGLSVGPESATIAGAVATGTSDQSVAVEYGPTAAYGSTVPGPVLVAEFGQTPVEVELGGLTPSTTYHFRLVATGPLGETVRGADGTLTTTARTVGEPPAEVPSPAGGDAGPGPGSGGGSNASSGLAAVRTRGGALSPARSGVVRIATLSCPAGPPCALAAPARVKVTIVRKGYRAKVLVPRSLAGGASASLRVRLPKAALAALAGRRATVIVPVKLGGATARRTVRVKAKLSGAGPSAPKRG